MTADELTSLGRRIYGRHWQSELACVLARDTRTVRRWKSGESPVPNVVARKLRSLAADHARNTPTERTHHD